MNHPDLIKKTNNEEYTRRYNRLFFMHALSLLPMLVFVLILWLEGGDVEASAVYLSGASYLLVLMSLRNLWRRDVLSGMRREGMIDVAYRPPVF